MGEEKFGGSNGQRPSPPVDAAEAFRAMATAQKPPRCCRRKPHRNMTRGGGLSCRRERSLSSTMMSSLVDVSFIHRRHGSPKGLGALRRCRLVRSALRAPERRTAITSSPSRERGGLHVTGITSSRRLQGARRRKDDSRGGQGASPSPSRPPALTLSCLPTTFHSVANPCKSKVVGPHWL